MKQLEGRTALVTGGSRGIGRAIALALAGAGCDVAVNYRSSAEAAGEIVRTMVGRGRRAISVAADVSSETEVRRLFLEVEMRLAPVDILVVNAGINSAKPLEEISLEDWRSTLDTNLTSAFLLAQAAIPGMRRRSWGRLILLSSIAAQTGGVIGPHYAASKAGMLGLVHSYANLLAKEGITANAIAPALIETDMIRGNDRIKPSLIPIGRFGTSEEVAEAAVLLASNGYITGQTINLNGGWYMS